MDERRDNWREPGVSDIAQSGLYKYQLGHILYFKDQISEVHVCNTYDLIMYY